MGQAVEERGGHLGVAEDGRPLAEGEVRCDDDGALLVECRSPPAGKIAHRWRWKGSEFLGDRAERGARFCESRDLLLLAFGGGIDSGDQQSLGIAPPLSRIEKRHQRVIAKGKDVLLLQVAITQLPEPLAVFLNKEMEPAAISKAIRLVFRLGVLAGEVGERHG